MTRPEIHPLTTSVGVDALAAAAAQADPDSLAAATALRSGFPPDLAAAALTQIGLRRAARSKLGGRADRMLFTRAGLEQASRAAVAAHHAARFAAAGVHRVVDLGCGIGADALALLEAGLEVVAVEADPGTASVAQANLGDQAEVLVGDAVELAAGLLGPGVAAFADPARRTGRGRSWRVEDLSPPWSFVERLLDGGRVAGVKLGPGLPHRVIPPGVEAEWVSERGDTVEVGLWSGPGARPDTRAALVLPDDRLVVDPTAAPLPAGPVGSVLYEPAGAVIRAGAIAQLGAALDARLLHPDIAYLTADTVRPTPYATAFEVLEVHAYTEQDLRHWARDREIGTLEIKKRGLDLDPAVLRKRLKLRGSASATIVLTRGSVGALLLVVRRLRQGPGTAGAIVR
ncbi:MAG TPA: class I SAM-dependent methyltransferase [Microlunatus sp.]|nr:class I SAM-dependent methyltransferase [Microlunatus sp.]